MTRPMCPNSEAGDFNVMRGSCKETRPTTLAQGIGTNSAGGSQAGPGVLRAKPTIRREARKAQAPSSSSSTCALDTEGPRALGAKTRPQHGPGTFWHRE